MNNLICSTMIGTSFISILWTFAMSLVVTKASVVVYSFAVVFMFCVLHCIDCLSQE